MYNYITHVGDHSTDRVTLAVLASGASADISYTTTPTVYWPFIESAIGIVGACLPLFRPLFGSNADSSKGLGQVRNLRSVRLDSSTSDEMPTLTPWSDDSSQMAKNISEVSIRKIVPSALEPWEERRGKGDDFA